jgi:hypothetical protein
MRKHCLVLYGVFSHYLVQELCAQNCFVSQFPQLYGGTEGDSVINGMDMNPNSKDMIFCGETSDFGLVSSTKLPNAFVFYMVDGG